MPSANKTPLGLNQWQANEYPKMADFNEDNRIIDQKLTELQSGSGVKIYTTTELSEPKEGKIYNVKITENTSVINEKPVYKENTTESVTLKAGKVATVYYQGGNFFYKASASGNAIAENVLADKKFSNDDDTDITGTMENHGAKIFTPSTANIIIPRGFHEGTGYVEGDSDLVAGNIVQGKQIFGVDGSALQYQQYEKTAIANALTSKGVPTSTTATWGQIEKNIRNIPTGIKSGSIEQFWIDKRNNKFSYDFKMGHLVAICGGYISGAIQILQHRFDNIDKLDTFGVFMRRGSSPKLNFEYDSMWAMGLFLIPKTGNYTLYVDGGNFGDQLWFNILNY